MCRTPATSALRSGSHRCRRGRCAQAATRRPSGAVSLITAGARRENFAMIIYLGRRWRQAGDPAQGPGEAVPRIDKALVAASRAIRIANDLASVDRDRAEGRLNLLLLPPAGTADIAALERQVDRYVRLHDHLLRDVADAGVLRRSLHVAVAVYRVTDLR